MISIKSLNKFYNKNRSNEIHVINDVSLELPDKGMVALFGKSGCGKTTMLNAIGGLDRTDSGSILIDGENIAQNTDIIRNKYIGYIFQNYNLNVLENNFDNVADALRICGVKDKDEIERRTIAALENVGMDKYKYRYPNTLSGGQQQRIAIARAIVKGPRIILADEPTGNLDEANTIMIMNMLKSISKNHLVLIVTHEANLVDYYCDKVIELSDGKVINIRDNENALGYSAKSKNDIYLGELEKNSVENDDVQLEFYGDAPSQPIKLKLVNTGGKFYIRIDTPKVQILDNTSEVKLREGTYAELQHKLDNLENKEMAELPPINGNNYGKLFTVGSSIKSGYKANFSKTKKKSPALLRVCMFFFAIVLVVMTAINATAFRDYAEIKHSYNPHVFNVYIPNAETADKLAAAKGSNGIEYTSINPSMPTSLYELRFISGYFETSNTSSSSSTLVSPVTFLDTSLAKGLSLIAGKNTDLSFEEILITTVVADNILETSNLGYIKTYDDLIGLISPNMILDGRNVRIAGIVRSNENAVFLTPRGMAERIIPYTGTRADTGDRISLNIKDGETVLLMRENAVYGDYGTYPSEGETVKIHGISLKISRVIKEINNYEKWCEENGIRLPTSDFYSVCTETIKSQFPAMSTTSLEFYRLVQEMYNEYYYEHMYEYYSHLDQFIEELYVFRSDDIDLWLYKEKGINAAILNYISNTEYLRALEYKEKFGELPTIDELSSSAIADVYSIYDEALRIYEEEYYSYDHYSKYIDGFLYLLSDGDYNALAYSYGETDPSATYQTEEYDKNGMVKFMLVYSSDINATEEFLNKEFADIEVINNPYDSNVISPNSVYDELIKVDKAEILKNFLVIVIFIAVMSLCMYFIMRSSLMNRVKEVGIYRAIGVSKSNILFRFFIEAFVLTTLTVFIGFAAASGLLFIWLGSSPLMSTILFYPAWIAGVLLIILYAVCLLCGCLPIISLMSKTPSEILSKYDI